MNTKRTLFFLFTILFLVSCNKKKNYQVTIYTQKLADDETAKFDDNLISLLVPITDSKNMFEKNIYSPFIEKSTVELYRIDYPDKKNVLKIDLGDNMMSTENNIIKKTKSGLGELKIGEGFTLPNHTLELNILSKYKDKIFIFDPNANANDSALILGNNYAKYSDIEQLKESLKQSIKKQIEKGNNLKNYAILYNVDLSSIAGVSPIIDTSIVLSPSKPEPPKLAEKKGANDKGGDVPPTKKTKKQLTANSIEDLLYKLTSTEYVDEEKENLASSGYLQFFQSNAFVRVVDNNNDPKNTYPIKEYIGHIRNRNIKLRTTEKEPLQGKCSKLTVREP